GMKTCMICVMPRVARPKPSSELSQLPAVDEVLRVLEAAPFSPQAPRALRVAAIREELASQRAGIRLGGGFEGMDALVRAIRIRLEAAIRPSLRPVLNATGILVHTNLGRVPLAPAALEAVRATCSGYNNLEFDLGTGS